MFGLVIAILAGCSKNDENPFDSLEHPGQSVLADTTSAYSITGLQKNIFSVKCAIPSCHGGAFEPDFRSVQSAYNTLVYHKVKKNNKKETFRYRVVPYDTAGSWLHQRIMYDDSLIGRMPLYSLPLTEKEADDINTWILNGAPDVNGNIAVRPNENPKIYGYAAYNQNDIRIDNNRPDWSDPFTAPANQNVKILMYVDDNETNKYQFEGNILKLSLNQDDFSNAVEVVAIYSAGPNYWGWLAKFNSGIFPTGSHVYMRYYVKDPDHTEFAERPVVESYSYLKGYYSFIIQ